MTDADWTGDMDPSNLPDEDAAAPSDVADTSGPASQAVPIDGYPDLRAGAFGRAGSGVLGLIRVSNPGGARAARSPAQPPPDSIQSDDAKVVQQAVSDALSRLSPGQSVGNAVQPLNGNFAHVNGTVPTRGWHPEPSIHGSAIESPIIPGQSAFALKRYQDPRLGDTMAIVFPTHSLMHYLLAPAFAWSGQDVNANVARMYLGRPLRPMVR